MKLDKQLYGWAIGAAWIFASAAQAHCNEISFNSLRNYFTSSSITADPGMLVMLGIGLIALRALIARRSKRREKGPAHS